jgi:hypothetical protein
MKTTIVNVRKHKKLIDSASKNNQYIYIGRGPGSKLGNPYTHLPLDWTKAEFAVATVEEAIEKYEAYARANPTIMAMLPDLVGKYLGCWCVQEPYEYQAGVFVPCHGYSLMKLINELGLEV